MVYVVKRSKKYLRISTENRNIETEMKKLDN